ncbi:hypothetical protein KFK14_12835 [Sphingobium phenoxybenzoativorans]|uniref:VRR-NUC domain-containing protein n=1 Tax=Sphingobium phenoxybenzoativorans TaxID=1592790 RepID=A0A975Q082_9SPHN|nr:hypothetical protein [Sphingobium phenoxybenzoativorans]QUT04032.1 hypothetical protein KFK14_12835 [Sphingobium phenoxybenzoativorans]
MTTPGFLVRLMTYVRLSRNVRLGPEDFMACEFANRLRVATLEGRLHAVWTHPAQELAHGHRNGVAGAISKALGLVTGTSDYLFLWDGGSAALEAKSQTGTLTQAQKDWREWCAHRGVPFHVFRTADEGEAILRGLGVLTP